MVKNWRKKKMPRKGRRTARRPAMKAVRAVVKSTLRRQMETKIINVADQANLAYTALGGIQMLAADVYSVQQGVRNSSQAGAANRIGDRIRAHGFQMNYYFTIPNFYNVGAASFYIPFVKVRCIVFQTANYIPALTSTLLFDTNFLPAATSTLQPVNYDGGFVKKVLYDKVFVIRNTLSVQSGGATGVNIPQIGNMIQWRKFIPYKNLVKFSDNSTIQPNSTDAPIYVAISAEVDDANTGLVPSGTTILRTTGYTRAWFKDYD